MTISPKITPMLWFDKEAEEAAKFYTSIFKNSKILDHASYSEVGQEITGGEPGSVMTVEFEIEGMRFIGLNGGPQFKFNEAVSFVINCENQAEVDYFWDKFTKTGGEESQCGWCKDKFGVSWQVTPVQLADLMSKGTKEQSGRVVQAMLQMSKLDVAKLQAAFDGK